MRSTGTGSGGTAVVGTGCTEPSSSTDCSTTAWSIFHGLDNLLWVWNPDRPARADRQFVDYFPGHDTVDVLALDCYGAFEQAYYDDLNALSDGKVMAIGETSHSPFLPLYEAQPKWAYYMNWAVDAPAAGGARPDLDARRAVRACSVLRTRCTGRALTPSVRPAAWSHCNKRPALPVPA